MPMSLQNFSATVSDVQRLNQKFLVVRAELVEPSRLEFSSGQYLILTVPGLEQKRSYSICSPAQTQHAVEILIDTTPQGPGSLYTQNLQPGDALAFMAPAGSFILTDSALEQEPELVFVATGSGISPIWSMIRDLLQSRGDTRPITLVWGLRSEQDIFWTEELEELQRAFSNFTVHLTLSQPSDEWPLCKGRVTACLTEHSFSLQAGYYLCGNGQMVEDVNTLLLEKGLSPDRIHREKFY